jgi:hypothetical protein
VCVICHTLLYGVKDERLVDVGRYGQLHEDAVHAGVWVCVCVCVCGCLGVCVWELCGRWVRELEGGGE